MNAAVSIPDNEVAQVMRVMPEHVTALWPQLMAVFAPALAMSSTHDAESVRRALLTGKAQLWAQIDGNAVQAAATTEFVDYPKGVFVRVWLAGALRDCKMNEGAFFDLMEAWRVMHGCIGFEAIGRHGWLRRFPDARVEGLVMRWVMT